MGMLDGFFNKWSETAGALAAEQCDTPSSLLHKYRQLKDPTVLANWFNPLSYIANEAGFLRGGTEALTELKTASPAIGVKTCNPSPHM